MDLVRTLNSVGKAIFVKYYYDFKTKTREDCIACFVESFTDKAKSTRTGHAQRIFRENKHIEALNIIIQSNRLDSEIINRAKEILRTENYK